MAAAASIEVVFGCATSVLLVYQSKMEDYSHHLRFGLKYSLCAKCCSTELVVGTNVNTYQVLIQLVSTRRVTNGRGEEVTTRNGLCITPEDWPIVLDFDKRISDFFSDDSATDFAPLISGGFRVQFISGRRGKRVKLSLSVGAVMSIPGSDDCRLMAIYNKASRMKDVKTRHMWFVRLKECSWRSIVGAAARVKQMLPEAKLKRRQEMLNKCRGLFETRVRHVCKVKTMKEIVQRFWDLYKVCYWKSTDDYAMLSRAMPERVLQELLPEFIAQLRAHV